MSKGKNSKGKAQAKSSDSIASVLQSTTWSAVLSFLLLFTATYIASRAQGYNPVWPFRWGQKPTTSSASSSAFHRHVDEWARRDGTIFQVRDIPGKGKGVIATRDIEQGELILRERPLFVVPLSIGESPTTLMERKLSSLSSQQREDFFSLSWIPQHLPAALTSPQLSHDKLRNQHPYTLALAIFQTNAVTAGSGAVGIFPRMARLNHGCAAGFNVVYSYREAQNELRVYALKGIKKGEEVLTTYSDMKKRRSDRQSYLSSHYGFTCTCSTCSLPDSESNASDTRLTQMADLYSQLRKWSPSAPLQKGRDTISLVNQIWHIGSKEEYWSERGQLAADAAVVAASYRDAAATVAWTRLAIKWFSIELGGDSPQVLELQPVLDPNSKTSRDMPSPDKHPHWGAAGPSADEGTLGPEASVFLQ